METLEGDSEIVYGTHDDTAVVMSEKVQSLAGSIYTEFERMIQRYDEDVVKSLMPLLVNVLECLDSAYQTNQEQDVELELLREDNEQLVTQYEREKNARKQAEQKLLETEDLAEQENKELSCRLESLESIVRMLELKHKNSMDHSSRLEERESELKKEYSKLHERYTDLFKTHVDYMERAKIMMGNSSHSQISGTSDRLDIHRSKLLPIVRSSGPISYGFTSLENSAMLDSDAIGSDGSSSASGPSSLHNELDQIVTAEKSSETEKTQQVNQATSPQSETLNQMSPSTVSGRTTTKKEQRSGNTLYQELSFQDDNVENEDTDITGGWVHPGDYASSVNDNFFGMGKEVENLIMENNELLATKNALNIVKDDLIVRVDELSGEIEILREELNAVILSRNKLKTKVGELEEELKKTKAQIKQNTTDQEEEGDIPMAQRKRFTRVEMARVLMERNQYKERFMELQDAVRWTEMMRASRVENLDKKSKQSIWKFFSNLFSSNDRPPPESSGRLLRYNTNYSPSIPGISEGRLFTGGTQLNALKTSNVLVLTKEPDSIILDRASQRRRDQYRQVRAHVQKEDGRLHAYGWSLPSAKLLPTNNASKVNNSVPVPVPVYCRPLAEASPHMKVWCASGVNLCGGFTKDGGCMVGASIFYSKKSEAKMTEITDCESDVVKEFESMEKKQKFADINNDIELSSYVWICTSTHSASTVTVIDAKNPAEVLDSFPVCQNHLLCICTVQGAMEMDYALLENSEVTKTGEMLQKPGESPNDIGRVIFMRHNPNSNASKNEEGKAATTTIVRQSNEQSQNKKVCIVAADGTDSNSFSTKKDDMGMSEENDHTKDETEDNEEHNQSKEPFVSSVGPTMWMGAQNGMLYVHSSITRWNICLHKVKLPDSVLSIVHVESRVVVALANGSLAIFRRKLNGEWDTNNYHMLTLGSPKHSIRCLAIVGDKVWAAHRNRIYVIDVISLTVLHSFEAHPRKESQIRQMTATGLGVWISIRLDSTLRLFSSETFLHMQDIDIEPYVSKMLGTGKLGFSFVRITALLVSCNRLWIGTGNGVVISVPLNDSVGPLSTRILPRCCMANAQLSFHGHRDAVKFFVTVPMNTEGQNQYACEKDMLVLSGGEGYIDFRLEESLDDACDIASHILVWRVYASNDNLTVNQS
ncbi:JNK-interacting protein 3 isoform X2 [Toxorhynchites rutilus septentrionalis]|uniref:JNK-interacting protein 3 isoform X2 n=1 Tax=Toxorhynchites rutilus septentrionalis TaxID=329112 RepID=UPI00247A1335|nr:JNK-interacting protein 3 isoform X2 [Toxorhynchites rutilus septentrionalis]